MSPPQIGVVCVRPGYLRLHVPGLYRNEAAKQRIEARLIPHPGVRQVSANTLTGNVLVLGDALDLDRITAALRGAPTRHGSAPAAAPWHALSVERIAGLVEVDPVRGLAQRDAAGRALAGANALHDTRRRGALSAFLAQFTGLPVLLLTGAAAVSLVSGALAEAVALFAVILLNAAIGMITERHAEATIAAMMGRKGDTALVLRDGRSQALPLDDVVRGDLLVLLPDTRVPADARVCEAAGLTLDESALTGESQFVTKQTAPVPATALLADRHSMVYRGTTVAGGYGLAIAVAVGGATEIGKIGRLMATVEQPPTPIQQQLDKLGKQLVQLCLAACGLVLVIGALRRESPLAMLKLAVSLAIAAVPEGLPTVATASLARGLVAMRKRHVLVRRLTALETLGAVGLLCLDKTGTVTMNRMSVVALATPEVCYGDGAAALWDKRGVPEDVPDAVLKLLQVCVLCSESAAPAATAGNGSSTEHALLQIARQAGITAALRDHLPLLDLQLRAPGRPYMSSVHGVAGASRRLVTVKGSPQEVLALCTRVEGEQPMTPALRARIAAQNTSMAARQLRVLGFAYRDSPDGRCEAADLTWLGLAGMADPVRPGVPAAIDALHAAGIRTVMITGDQHQTALAIARDIGLGREGKPQAIDPARLRTLQPAQLKQLADAADVFARVSPEQKLWIVQALQAQSRVVAMTGDGINDGPALRAADVGIALGRHGSDLARSAADVVLEDDRLDTILDAIRTGRTITRNIEKSLHFLISSNLSEILFSVGAVALAGGTPLTPMQLLWINLLSDVLPAIALAAEPAEDDVMQHPPRARGAPLIGATELRRYGREAGVLAGGALVAYGAGLLRYGPGARASGLAFNALTLGQLLHTYSCRSPKRLTTLREHNPWMGWSIGGMLALQAAANLTPGLRSLLGLQSSGLADLAIVFGGAALPLVINEAAKPAAQT